MRDDQTGMSEQARVVGDDIASLKADMAELIRQMGDLARREAGRVSQDAAETISEKASDIYETVSDTGRRSASVISARMEEKPVTTLLIAFATGFVFSKLLTR